MGQIDLLLAALSQKLLDLVPAVGEGGGLGLGKRGRQSLTGLFRWRSGPDWR